MNEEIHYNGLGMPDNDPDAELDAIDNDESTDLDSDLESASAARAEGETLKGYAAPMATTIRGDID